MKRLFPALPLLLLAATACGGPIHPMNGSMPADATPAPPPQVAPREAASADMGPAVPSELAEGESLYVAKCSSCHGTGALGTVKGPPFLHPVYVPSHHPDQAFVNAALNGVKAHHWQFGDMPPVEGATEAEVLRVVAYVRWLQQRAQ